MTKDTFIQWLLRHGYKPDKYGHYQKTIDGELYRMKLQSNSVRFESRITHPATEYSKAENEWLRLRSGYYKNLSLSPEDKIIGLKR